MSLTKRDRAELAKDFKAYLDKYKSKSTPRRKSTPKRAKAAKPAPKRKSASAKRSTLYDDSPLSPRAKRSSKPRSSRIGAGGTVHFSTRGAAFVEKLRSVDRQIRALPRPKHFMDRKGGDGYSGYGRISMPGVKRYMGVGGDTWNAKNEAQAREIIYEAFGPSATLVINID